MKKESNLKSIISVIILFLLTILVLYFSLKNDFSNIISQILSVNIFLLIVAFIFFLLYWVFKSIVLYNFTKKFNENYKFSNDIRTQAVTQFFNAVTPFQVVVNHFKYIL